MSRRKTGHPTNPEVRAWADARFYNVPKSGALPDWVIAEWDKRHPKRKYVREQAHHGTLTGYTYHGCREDCCRLVWNEYQAAYEAA